METQILKEQFKKYRDLGFKAFPILCYVDGGKREKKPMVDWRVYQNRFPSDNEIDKWCANPLAQFYGIAVSTEDMLVVDLDQKDGRPDTMAYADELGIDGTMWTTTASGGVHAFYLNPTGERNHTNIFKRDKDRGDTIIDVRANGGLVVVGPSELWSENPLTSKARAGIRIAGRYKTDNLCVPQELPETPSFIIEAIAGLKTGDAPQAKYKNIQLEGKISEGGRHEAVTSLAYRIISGVKDIRDLEVGRRTFWETVKDSIDGWEENKKEYEIAWSTGIEKMRAKRGAHWPDQANVKINRHRETVKKDLDYEEDIEGWGLKIKEVIRIGEIYKFRLDNDEQFEVLVEDINSQTKFMTAYSSGTNKFLAPIRKNSYVKFLQSLQGQIVEWSDSSVSAKDVMRDFLLSRVPRLDSCETEDQAREMVATSQWALWKDRVYFMVSSIISGNNALSRKTSQSRIVSILDDLGAKQDQLGKIKFYYYDT